MPLEGFYSSSTHTNESAVDYWTCINKSTDAAVGNLQRGGRAVEDRSAEMVTMFINHCPDPNLSTSLQLKAPEQWTAA